MRHMEAEIPGKIWKLKLFSLKRDLLPRQADSEL